MRNTVTSFQIKIFYKGFTQNFHVFCFNLSPDTHPQSEYFTKAIMPYDARSQTFTDVTKKEIVWLLRQNTQDLRSAKEVLKNATALEERSVLAVKDEGTFNEIWKARFVTQEHKILIETSLVHKISVARQHSTKIIFSSEVIFQFRIFSTDVTQASLQSKKNFQREIYVKPCRKFGLNDDKFLKLLNPLYGLSGSGDY